MMKRSRSCLHGAAVAMSIAVGAALGGVACSRARAVGADKPEAPAGADVPTVAAARVVRADLAETLTLAAEFRPFQEIDIHAKVAGYVKAIHVDVGDHVREGQLLAELEIPELQDEMRQDDAAVRRNSEEIRRAEADLQRTESNHEVAHLGSTRLAAVAKERPGLIAQQDLDDANAKDRVAEAQVATAKAALASAQQQLEVAKATQTRTQTLFAYARITAPFAGVITHRYADTGAMIQAGTSSSSQAMPVVKLSQNDLLRLIIPVPESGVSHVRLGEPVDVRVDALGRTFPGRIARFSDKLNTDTRTMETEVDVPNRSLELVPGMYATASIRLKAADGVLTIPVQALDRSENAASVLVIDHGQIARRDVRVGIEAPDKVEIVSGLHENELVVVGSRSQLRPGTAVTPKLVDLAGSENEHAAQH